MTTALPSICMLSRQPAFFAQAESLAQQLALPLCLDSSLQGLKQGAWQSFLRQQADFVLLCGDAGLSLWDGINNSWIVVDFTAGSADHRRKFGGGSGQLIAKAVGYKGSCSPKVLDATAGLGADAFVLASLGCQLKLLERNPYVYQLLADGLARARYGEPELREVIARMDLSPGNSLDCLELAVAEFQPDVIYLDPMYPSRKKSASVKKEMAAFHRLVGQDEDGSGLLSCALATEPARVVVKRPKAAPTIDERKPSHTVESKNGRYDVYVLRAIGSD